MVVAVAEAVAAVVVAVVVVAAAAGAGAGAGAGAAAAAAVGIVVVIVLVVVRRRRGGGGGTTTPTTRSSFRNAPPDTKRLHHQSLPKCPLRSAPACRISESAQVNRQKSHGTDIKSPTYAGQLRPASQHIKTMHSDADAGFRKHPLKTLIFSGTRPLMLRLKDATPGTTCDSNAFTA